MQNHHETLRTIVKYILLIARKSIMKRTVLTCIVYLRRKNPGLYPGFSETNPDFCYDKINTRSAQLSPGDRTAKKTTREIASSSLEEAHYFNYSTSHHRVDVFVLYEYA